MKNNAKVMALEYELEDLMKALYAAALPFLDEDVVLRVAGASLEDNQDFWDNAGDHISMVSRMSELNAQI